MHVLQRHGIRVPAELSPCFQRGFILPKDAPSRNRSQVKKKGK